MLAGEVIRRVSLGDLGRAAQLSGQAKVAAPSPEVREELQGLLMTLAAERGLLLADPSCDEEVLVRDLATALRRAPRSSGAGPPGSRLLGRLLGGDEMDKATGERAHQTKTPWGGV